MFSGVTMTGGPVVSIPQGLANTLALLSRIEALSLHPPSIRAPSVAVASISARATTPGEIAGLIVSFPHRLTNASAFLPGTETWPSPAN